MRLQLSSKYGEYDALMRFLTETGMDFLEMIDLREIHFSNLLESVYKKTNTSYFKDVLQQLRDNYSTGSTRFGRYTIRYLLLNLREDLLERVMPSQFSPQWKCKDLYLSRKCFPFECNPLASDLADSKTSQISQAKYLARVVEKEKTEVAVPYWSIVKSMQDTGEIYCDLGGDLTEQAIQKYNDCLDDWEKRQGYEIISDGNAACIAAYEASTLFILNKLLELSQIHNKGQKEVNERYLRNCDIAFSDPKKEEALKYAFVNSRVLLVYGAAGTGKTTLIDMISTMLSGRRKLFLTKTHTALQNLQRRINNPGADASFVSINTEHYVGGYKSDIYIQDTNTIIEVKSVLSTEKCALFPTVFSERALKQLEKLRDLLSLGYRVHYSVISLNPYVSSIYFVSDAQFTPLLKSCIDLGMTISAFSCRIDDNRVYIDKRLQIILP